MLNFHQHPVGITAVTTNMNTNTSYRTQSPRFTTHPTLNTKLHTEITTVIMVSSIMEETTETTVNTTLARLTMNTRIRTDASDVKLRRRKTITVRPIGCEATKTTA